METLQMRRCSSVEWKPSPVLALTSSFDGSQVAAVRQDGMLEIWLVAPGSVGWHCQLTIQGDPVARVSSVVWCRPTSEKERFGRLLSSSLDGSVLEWDISSLTQHKILDCVAGSIFQMALEPNQNSVSSNSRQFANGHVSTQSDVHSESESSNIDNDDDSDDETCSTYVGATYQRLAMACGDGSVRLYNVPDSDALNYLRSFPRVSGKMLSVTWSNDAKFIFSGSSDGLIRCWDVRSFHEKYRITAGLGGVGSGPELCIWSLLSLRCGTLVSGDSTGSIQFWDAHHGTLVQAHRHHKGDVLALATDPNHKRVFSAGSDGQVILYKLSKEDTSAEETSKWAYVKYIRAHTHDIRALTMAVPICREDASIDEGKAAKIRKKDKPIEYSYHKWSHLGVPMLISAGDDAKLFAYSAMEFTNFAPHDICPAPQRPLVNLANQSASDGTGSIVLIEQSTRLDVKLRENVSGHAKRTPNQLTRLVQLKSEGSRRIICSAISGDGTYIAYSHDLRPRLFELRCQSKGVHNNKGMWSLKKLELPKGLPSACCMVFSVDSLNLIIGGRDRKIYVVDVRKSEIIGTFDLQRKAIDMDSTVSESPATKMFTSYDGQWLAATNCFGDVYVFNLETQRQHWYVHRLNEAAVTAGGFVPGNSNVLVVTTSGNEVYVLDVEAKQMGEWSRRHTRHLPRSFREFPGEVIGLAFPPCLSYAHSVIVYSSRAMCFIDFSVPVVPDKDEITNLELSLDKFGTTKPGKVKLERKRRRNNLNIDEGSRQCKKNFDFCAFEHPVLFVSHLPEGSLFILEKRWMDVVKTCEALPVDRHVYGT
ncbi:U3 small nucleolar RNA-associated protein 4 [Rhynchospora pubera]|uniref:U3 small nucleolar RNA-associated protein 4 n=1 Tax=Rhynchospora pubera TaxID=906938 RepID=A0AAV8DDD8_9POAL|nr:U3 small nucleolar RNA-associated protein 4 [Rhynchospora pubera]